MPDQSFAQFERKIAAVEREFDGSAGRARLARVAKLTAGDVDEAVHATLGDDSMSGWKRGSPIAVKGVSRVLSDDAAFVSAGKGSGPMRVLQQGRNQGNASGFSGPGINTKTGTTARTKSGGLRKVRARKARRWNGTTQGKHTWDHAAALMADRVPKRLAAEVHKALAKHLRGG